MPDIDTAITNLRAAAVRYDKPDRYYRGDHDLAFATEKFENAFGSLFREFALNLCPAICDAVRDKLKITGFSISGRDATDPKGGTATVMERAGTPPQDTDALPHPPEENSSRIPHSALRSAIDQISSSTHLDLTAEEVHLEALKVGDSYAIVWPDENGNVTIYPQRAAACTVQYDDEVPGRMLWAAKYWRTSDCRVRLNLLYPDRIERYTSRSRSDLTIPDAREFIPFEAESAQYGNANQHSALLVQRSVVPNPYGQIPLFHFANTSEIGSFGRSELQPAIPIQNGLNKAVLDMLVAMEFSAFRQRWASGLDIEFDDNGEPKSPFKAGLDRIWLSSNPQTTFGDFNTTDLDQFLKVKDSFRIDVASVTGTPLHYFLQNTRGFASGEAFRRAEARFLAKVRDRQRSFGHTWAQLMSFALRVAGLGDNIRLRTQWEDLAPMSEREFLENLLLKKQLGLPTHQALLEAGYGDEDIRSMLAHDNSMQKPARQQGRNTQVSPTNSPPG